MKRIIVTGGSGYVGAEVVELLIKKKYSVLVVDKQSIYKNSKATFLKKDLLSEKGLARVFQQTDSVIHLAAEVGGVSFANNYPATIIHNNALIDLNCIKAAAAAHVRKYLYVSSSLVYEQAIKFPLKEADTLHIPPPHLSYGAEKLFGESLCEAFFQEFDLQYAVCRLFNVYGINAAGFGDPNGHVIPDIISKVKESSGKVEIWGRKNIRRNFTHVSDIARGIVAALENENKNEVFNIADKNEYSIEDVTLTLWKLLRKPGLPNFYYVKKNKQDVLRNFASVNKAMKILNWRTKTSLQDGLKAMI